MMCERNALEFAFKNAKNSASSDLNRKRKNDNVIEDTMSKHSKNNYYAILDNELEECNEVIEKFEQYLHTNNLSNEISEQRKTGDTTNNITDTPTSGKSITNPVASTNVNNDSETKTNTNVKHKNNSKNIPPINTFDIESKQIIELIKDGLMITQFTIKEYKQNKLAIYLKNITDYKRVRGYLEKSKVKFYSYTPKCLKTKTILMKGLNSKTDTKDILSELCNYQNDNLEILKVTQFTTKNSTQQKIKLPIFMVQISAESNVNELKQIKTILYHCIKWEHLRRPEITQCRNCQSFFHSAANCNLPSRCVKCSGTHKTEDCSSSSGTLTERENVYCVLCKKFGHPASYKGCDRYKELQQKIRLRKHNLIATKTSTTGKFTSPNFSYADVTKENIGANSPTNNQNLILLELKNTMLSLSRQIMALQKQLEIQTARIDAICNIVDSV